MITVKNREKIEKLFLILNKIDNIPVILTDVDKIIYNFEFALKTDPFLYIQLLKYANLDGFGFPNKIFMIEDIYSLIEEEMLRAIIKSNAKFEIIGGLDKELSYYLLIYPFYLTIADILKSPDWLSEEEQLQMILIPTGFMIKKLYFHEEYLKIKDISFKKRISIKEGEDYLGYPNSTLLLNIHFVNKNVPLIISDFISSSPLTMSQGKISFILELVDRFLFTRFYSFPKLEQLLVDFISEKLSCTLELEELYNILLSKTTLLFNNLLSEDMKNQIFYIMNESYQREQEREKSRYKISITDEDRIYDLEEI